MRKFQAFIADLQNSDLPVDTLQGSELPGLWEEGNEHVNRFTFEVPDDIPEYLIPLIGRGLFFDDDFSAYGTMSTIVEVTYSSPISRAKSARAPWPILLQD